MRSIPKTTLPLAASDFPGLQPLQQISTEHSSSPSTAQKKIRDEIDFFEDTAEVEEYVRSFSQS